MPGKSQSGKVVIRNGADHKREVFFRVRSPADDTTSGKNGNYCAGQRERSDTDSLSGNGDRDDVKQNQSLGEILPGKDKQVEFLFLFRKRQIMYMRHKPVR